MNASHADPAPSGWVARWAGCIPACGSVLDVACGQGRHALFLAASGYAVTAVDRDPGCIGALAGRPGITALCADLEADEWPFPGRQFEGVVVTNYLHRPLFRPLVAAVRTGGVLVYETFALGNERYGRPSNPDFLLRAGELLDVTRDAFEVIAYEHLDIDEPRPAIVQRICARKTGSPTG